MDADFQTTVYLILCVDRHAVRSALVRLARSFSTPSSVIPRLISQNGVAAAAASIIYKIVCYAWRIERRWYRTKNRLRSPRDGRVPTIAKDSLRHHRLYATPACHGAFTLCHWAPDRQKSIPWTVTLSWLPRAYSRLLFVGRWLWPGESVRLTKFWCAIRVH